MLEFETANQKDIPELTKLLNILFSQDIEFVPDEKSQSTGLNQIISNSDIGKIYLAKYNNLIIGMVIILNTISTALGNKVGILEDMRIHPDYQKLGYGKKLINYAINNSKKNGIKRITLLTDHDNYNAINFYQKEGFLKSVMIPLRKFV